MPLEESKKTIGLKLNGKHQLLAYADMLGENLQTITENAEIFIKVKKNIGVEVNSEKTMYDQILQSKCIQNQNIVIGNL